MREYRETCCAIMSKSSQIFQFILLKLTKLCSNADLANTVEKGQYFTTLDDAELDKLKVHVESTHYLKDKLSQVKGWIRGNTKIGPVLDVAVSYHQGRYGVEIMIESLFSDKTCSWRWNSLMGEDRERDKQVRYGDVGRDSHRRHWREYGETRCEGKTGTDTKFNVIFDDDSSAVSWAEMDRGRIRKVVWKYPKLMIKLVRHDDTAPREDDGAVKFQELASIFRSEFTSSSTLVNSNMAKFHSKRRWSQEEIPILRGSRFTWNSSFPSSNSQPFWKNTVILHCRQRVVTERLRRAHLSRCKLPWPTVHHPVRIDSGWENVKEGRHAVFFTAVNPMFVDQHKEVEYDLTKPRIAVYKNNWKIHQNTIYGCTLRVAQGKGLQFNQTRSNAIILYKHFTRGVHRDGGGTWSQEKNSTVKCINLLSYRRVLYSSPNLHYGRQDTANFEARTSVDHLSREYGETRSGGEYGQTRCGRRPNFSDLFFSFFPDVFFFFSEKKERKKKPDPNREALESRPGKGSRVQPM